MRASSRNARLKSKLRFLKLLHSLPKSQQSAIVPYLSDNACECIYEAISNIQQQPIANDQVRRKLKRKLGPYKKDLKFLAKPGGSAQAKRIRLHKKGGALITTLLATVIPMVASALLGRR